MQKTTKDKAEQIANQLGMTAEQLTNVKQQATADRGRGRRPAGTAGAETKLAGWGQVEGQADLFAGDTPTGEDKPATWVLGDVVTYRGSLTNYHGIYVLDLDCRCALCDAELNQPIGRGTAEPHFEIVNRATSVRLRHVLRSSLATEESGGGAA